MQRLVREKRGRGNVRKRIRRVQGLFPIRAQQLQHNRGGVLNCIKYFFGALSLFFDSINVTPFDTQLERHHETTANRTSIQN